MSVLEGERATFTCEFKGNISDIDLKYILKSLACASLSVKSILYNYCFKGVHSVLRVDSVDSIESSNESRQPSEKTCESPTFERFEPDRAVSPR